MLLRPGVRELLKGLAIQALTALRDPQLVLSTSQHDEITGLISRQRLAEALESAAKEKAAHAVFCIGLNGFKILNNRFGRRIGDELLHIIGQRLAGQARGKDDVVARIGGDEFALLSKGVRSEEECVVILSRLTRIFESQFPLSSCRVSVSASVGFSLYSPGDSPSELLYQSERAMQAEKLLHHSYFANNIQKAQRSHHHASTARRATQITACRTGLGHKRPAPR
jgi:diguanylate cyclase (GGDEF)-like protein